MQIVESGSRGGADAAEGDLGPLAWVLEELRKSLESANKALKKFVRDTEIARGTDLASVDASHLRIARQQLHQAVGALEMVGLEAPAHVLRATEAAVQLFVQHPEKCNEKSVGVVERSGFALVEYLEILMAGGTDSAVGLFPQYRDVQTLIGAERIHPADLWSAEWKWVLPAVPAGALQALPDRARLDQDVLQVMQKSDVRAAGELRDSCQFLASSCGSAKSVVFWSVAAGFFDAIANGLLPVDLYAKRAASRVLLQYTTQAKGDSGIPDRLAKDLLFFCSQAVLSDSSLAPCLAAVRRAYALDRYGTVDYSTPRYGRFDPALLTQARKRIDAVKETWSAVSGGDMVRLKNLGDQFGLVAESILKLHPGSDRLPAALRRAAEMTQRSGKPPLPQVALEVATAVLYLEAALAERKADEVELATRTGRLADRIESVCHGGESEPLEHWMEELYRRVSDRQTMGTVVGELRVTLGEAEKALDQFFRNPTAKQVLTDVPGFLAQMRGVLSVLGLDHAVQAVGRMRESVEEILVTEVDEQQARSAGTFDKLGNNLGALGFMIDMLNYQPALARKLFVFDGESGELRPVMGRTPDPLAEISDDVQLQPAKSLVAEEVDNGPAGVDLDFEGFGVSAVVSEVPAPAAPESPAASATLTIGADGMDEPAPIMAFAPPVATTPPVADSGLEEDDLLDIFLEEAREVVRNGTEAIELLRDQPGDLEQQTSLRRAFHTLKGSSRMVGLTEFGEAAWSMEQVLNAWLAEQKPVSTSLCSLSHDAMTAFAEWVEDIAAGTSGRWTAPAFRQAADAFREQGRLLPLVPLAPAPAHVEEHALAVPAAESNGLPMVEAEGAETMTLPAEASSSLELSGSPEPVEAMTDAAEWSSAFETESSQAAVPEALAEPGTGVVSVDAKVEPVLPSVDGLLPDATGFEPIAIDGAGSDESNDLALSVTEEWADPTAPHVADSLMGSAEVPVVAEIEAVAGDDGRESPVQIGMDDPERETEISPASPSLEVPAAVHTLTVDTPDTAPDEGVVANLAAVDEAAPDSEEEQVKVIGSLRIGIPLYNVYLNEADEWSRRLENDLTEWSLEIDHPVPDSAEALAHSLAGSSATVGFLSLSGLARALEHALQRLHGQRRGSRVQAQALRTAAEEIRRLLHQFAAGFLKEPDPAITADLSLIDALDDGSSVQSEPSLAGLETVENIPDSRMQAEIVPAPESVDLSVVESPMPGRVSSSPAAAPPLPVHVEAAADDIDAVDSLDPDLFPIFEEEALELLPQLGGALRQWVDRPDALDARGLVLRALHTLKGSSRLAGALRLGEMAHRFESEIETLGLEVDSGAQIAPLLSRLDSIESAFDNLRSRGLQSSLPVAFAAIPSVPEAAISETREAPAPAAAETPIARTGAIALPAPLVLAGARSASTQAVRVRASILDRLVNQAGEVMITRSRIESELGQLRTAMLDLTGNLDRLRQQLRDIELQAETQMQSRLAQAKDSQQNFDPLEFDRFTRVQELTRMMAESVNDVATVQRNIQRAVEATEDDLVAQSRQTRELQRDLLRTRMVEFDGISERLYRVVRQASKDLGKQVKLDVVGGSIEMDRGVLERMTPAFEHLLRNCVVHGVEAPEVRQSRGKDVVGTIVIELQQSGNDVAVEFRDDGGGLDLVRLREKAVANGLVSSGQTLSDSEAANLVFMPGITTAGEVTELAGRGIGMDVVRSEVQSLGGRIETQTRAGLGASFRLILPLTTAVTQVVMMRTGAHSIGVPANVVELVRRVTPAELALAYESGIFDFAGERVPFFWSGALLQTSARSVEVPGRTLPVVIFRSASQRVAVHVDEVLGNQEVVVKNLGSQLARLPGLAGMTVLPSGAVVLIYNPVALATVYGEQARQLSVAALEAERTDSGVESEVLIPTAPVVQQVPLVLVVDDSITVRRVTQRLLQREGYRVALAADGLQALERLQDEKPAIVLSDIEMPRMDGFDLVRNIRADARLRELPVVMITSRIAEKHREHARELGVDHYLGKPYSEDELLALVQRYTAVPVLQ